MSTAVAYTPNRYSRVQMNTASLKGVPLHCIIFRTATDPACGSGNFLTETFLSLRHLENEILKEL